MANGNVFNAIYFADKQNAGTYIEKKDGNKENNKGSDVQIPEREGLEHEK